MDPPDLDVFVAFEHTHHLVTFVQVSLSPNKSYLKKQKLQENGRSVTSFHTILEGLALAADSTEHNVMSFR